VLSLAALAFFVSGFAALTYQVVWQRLLGLFSGSDIHSATIVVAAFMAGLGVGSLGGGRIADRLSARASLALFVAAELAIALFGFFSTDIYYGVLYARFAHLNLGPAATAAILFAGVLWPTFFMGLSLPLLTRGLATAIGRVARVAGILYGLNTLGAATGAIVATWGLLPRLGLEGSVRLNAMLNVLVAAIAAVVVITAKGWGEAPQGRRQEDGVAPAAGVHAFSYPAMVALSALAGFVALSFEIVWFRLLGVMLKSSASTFGTLLAVYLSGIGLGSAILSPWVHRFREPVKWFLAIQFGIAGYAAVSLTLLVSGLGPADAFAWLFRQFGSYDPLGFGAAASARGPVPGGGVWTLLALYIGLPLWLVGVPTLLMGMAFPLLQHAVQRDLSKVGSRVGGMLAGNIAGSTLGSLATGLVSLNWLGAAGTTRVLVGLGMLSPLLWLFRPGGRMPSRAARYGAAAAVVLTAVVLVAAMPGSESLWTPLHGARAGTVVVGEDATGVFALRQDADARPPQTVVFANGLGQGRIPYLTVHPALGALPAFIHENPGDALVIGLGSAGTLFGIAGRESLGRVTCVEIVRPQLPALQRLEERRPDPGLSAVLNDPRVTYVYGDGRTRIARSGLAFDIIEADALRPTSSYAGNLYSTDYFDLLRRHLRPGGLAVTWAPTDRTRNSFLKVFPHVLSFGSIVLGSNEPIRFDPDAVRGRIRDRRVQGYYRSAGVDIEALLAPYLDRAPSVYGPAFDRAALADLNTDLFPRDEFSGILRVGAAVFGW
jgi:predicted membrane-bound spermidine synthase